MNSKQKFKKIISNRIVLGSAGNLYCSSYCRHIEGKTMYRCLLFITALGLLFSTLYVRGQQKYTFEKLGDPLHQINAPITMVTAGSRPMAWVRVESPDLYDVFGIEIDGGKSIKLNLEKFGRSHIRMHCSRKGDVYIFYGYPAHFLKYDVLRNELVDLGQAAKDGHYFLDHCIGTDDRMWVGSYPDCELSWVDPATDKIGSFGSIQEDPREKYILGVKVSDANIVYCAVGLHHRELWAVDASSGKKKQILPEELTREQGSVSIQLGADGHVYGNNESRTWRCHPDSIEFVDILPLQRKEPDLNIFSNERFVTINSGRELIAQSISTHLERYIPTDFSMPTIQIYSMGPVLGGKIYGGGASYRPTLFTYDIKTKKLTDLGIQGAGNVQIYDILGHPRGVFLTSYPLGGIDLYEPATGKVIPIVQLAEKYQQERPVQLCLGTDGMIYTGTIPMKGLLGGALARVNPNDLSVKVWRNIIPEQSLVSVVTVPSTGEIFFTSSIMGGSSAIPSQKEGVVGFWNAKKEKVVWQGKPISGTERYGQASMGSDGMIYGVAGKKYYVINPKNRKVIFVDNLPVNATHYYAFFHSAAGPKGMIYGLGDDALFAIDPATKKANILARHESIKNAQGILVIDDGCVYYGSGAGLWCAHPKN